MPVLFTEDRASTVADLVSVARGRVRIEISPGVMQRLARSRAVLDRVAARGQTIYGLNTGLGAKSGLKLEEDAAAFQIRFLHGRAVGMGEPLSVEIIRAATFARIAGLATGGTGISPAVFEALVQSLNAGVHALIPSLGSIGAADLGPMAAVGLMLIGEGEAEFQGRIMSSAEALAAAGLQPTRLAPKDGLSLISASSISIGQGALVVADAWHLLGQLNAAVALTMEGLGANQAILDPRLQAARPAPGQIEVAAELRGLLEGGTLLDPSAVVPLQDPLSIRCAASINGALRQAIAHAQAMVEIELHASAENPLVLIKDERVLSTGNFHGPALGLAFEGLGLAIGQAAIASAGRFLQLTGAGRNGLPRGLSLSGGTSVGFAALQKTVAALLAGIRHAALPVVLDMLPVAEGVEDHATQAPQAVGKAAEIIALWRRLVALELMAAAQAVDLRPGHRLGQGTAAVHDKVRSLVDPFDEDRPLGRDAENLARHLEKGWL
jgi:histidine ammonia-lyase